MSHFVDSDGVLYDFDRQAFNLFGKWPKEFQSDDVMWEMIKEHADEFWSTLPLKYGAMKLWETVVEHSPVINSVKEMPIILTGCPKNHYDIASDYKVANAKRHFGEDVQIITCLSRNKPFYMRAAGDILIDDFSRNTKRWIKAGGRAVKYYTWEQAIEDFKVLVKTPYISEPTI